MLQDKSLQFTVDGGQAVTTSAASANVVDTVTGGNLGESMNHPMFLTVQAIGAMTAAGATVQASLRTSATISGGALNGTIKTLAVLPEFAALSAGGTKRVITLPIESAGNTYERYLDVYFTVTSGPSAGAKFFATLTDQIDTQKAYPSSITAV